VKIAAEWIGLVTAVALLLGVLVGGIRYTVRQDLAAHSVSIDGLRSDIANLRSDITRIDGRITSTESKVDGLLSKALDKAFSKTSSGKIASRDAIETASQIIDVARSFEVKLSPETIRLTGNRLVSLSGKEQPIAADAWRVLQSTLGYASAITLPAPQWELTPPVPGNPTPFGDFEMEGVRQFFSAKDQVPIEEAGGGYTISSENRIVTGMKSRGLKVGPAYVMYLGSGDSKIVLDGLHLRNAILKNMHVIYYGTATILEGVYFLNCTFEFRRAVAPSRLAQEILRQVPVAFKVES
jgi:hypothetical protein